MAENMKILALDLGTISGWAHSSGASGTWNLSVRPDESTGMRLIRLQGKLNKVLADAGIELVVFEIACDIRYGAAIRALAKMQGVLEAWCIGHDVEFKGYTPKEIKKHATGKGNANKAAMLKAACERWPGAAVVDDNEADALWALDLALTDIGQSKG